MFGVYGSTLGNPKTNCSAQSESDNLKVTRSESQSNFDPGLICNWGTPPSQESPRKPKFVQYSLPKNRFFLPNTMSAKTSKSFLLDDEDDNENNPFAFCHSLTPSSGSSNSSSSLEKRKATVKFPTPKKIKRKLLSETYHKLSVPFLSPEKSPPQRNLDTVEDSLLCLEKSWYSSLHKDSSPCILPDSSPILRNRSPSYLIGFPNFGNTCYINVTLQALLAIPEFIQSLEEASCTTEECDGIIMYLCKIILARKSESETEVESAMLNFYHLLPKIHPSYSLRGQQDASEFLMRLLDYIKPHLPDRKLVERIFEFQVAEIRTCSNCGTSDERLETHSLLWLPISESRHHTLVDCLSEYFSPDDQRPLVCPKCDHKHVKVVSKLSTLPRVMLLTIKRYTTVNEKVSHPIIPPLDLDVSTFIQKPVNGSTHYKLKSLILHLGSSNDSGHYVCYVHNDTDHLWRLYSDRKVTQASENEIQDSECNRNAYVYFYLRHDSTK